MTGPAISRATLRRVVVRGPNWLGDTVMAEPTLRTLRAALPGVEVWGVGRFMGDLLGDQGLLDRHLVPPRGPAARVAAARRLPAGGADLALLFPGSLESALWARLTGARWRVGYRGEGRGPLLTHALEPADGAVHQVLAYLRLLAPLGIPLPERPPPPVLRVDPERRTVARELLARVGIEPPRAAVGIQLGAALGPAKLWAAARLAVLAARLEDEGTPAVFLGAPSAAPLLAAVGAAGGAPRSLVGQDSPALLPALLAELAAVVSSDTGPAHVAAAVGTPVVALFGPTDPRRTAPLGPGCRPLWARPSCAPCFRPRCPIDHRCLTAIGVDEVVAAVRAVWPAGQAGR